MNKILITLLLIFSFSYAFKVEQEFNIKTIEVQSKTISEYKEFYGKVVPDNSKVYNVTMRFDGFVTKLYTPEPFSYVNKGDNLFHIYSQNVYNLYDELAIAKNRSQALYKSIEKKFQLLGIDPQNKKGDDTLITSEFNGYITKHNLNVGSYVKQGANLFEITDLSNVWVLVNIYQKDIDFVKLGMEVELSFDGIQNSYTGKVDLIYPNINPNDQSVTVKVVLENKQQELYPNMFAKAKLIKNAEQILIVPHNAVIQRNGKQYVFMKEGKAYTPSEVTAIKTPDGYKIVEGLEAGDMIVTNALFLLDSDAITNGLYSDDW